MKKFLATFVTCAVTFALTCSFAACDFGVGNNTPNSDPGSSEETVDPAYAEAVAIYNRYVDVIDDCTVEEGEYDVYTKSSVAAAKETLEGIIEGGIEGKTVEEITALNGTLANLVGTLVTVDDAIDARLQLALDSQLNLRRYYKVDGSDATYADFDYYGLVQTVGVDIMYNKATNTANFLIPTDTLTKSLRTFINSGVLDLFTNSFSDVYAVEFTVNVYTAENPEVKTEQKISITGMDSTSGGMILAAGLLAITMGYEQEVYDAYVTGDTTELYSALGDLMGHGEDQATYESIAGKGCSAKVVFNNDDYYFASTFAINFESATFGSGRYFTAPGVLY